MRFTLNLRASIFSAIVAAPLFLCLSCNSSESRAKRCDELAPQNPYEEGSGHYAGFEWAEEKQVSSCGGNSQSFVEGCEEYLQQEEAYENCKKE